METIFSYSDMGSNLSECIFWSFIIVLCGSWLHSPLRPSQSKHVLPTYFPKLWVGCGFFLFVGAFFCLFVVVLKPNLDKRSLIFPALHVWVGFSCVWNFSWGWWFCSRVLGFGWHSRRYGLRLNRGPACWRLEGDPLDNKACSWFIKWASSCAHHQ